MNRFTTPASRTVLALLAAALCSSPLCAQPQSEQDLKEAEAARLAVEKAKQQEQIAAQEMEAARAKAALGQGPVGVPGVKPALTFEQPVRDLGRVTDDAPVPVTFTFKNTSDQPVKITNMSGSCGCTVPQKPAKDVYLPGESGEVVATYNPANRHGKEVKHVYVDTDFAASPRVELTFQVETLARVKMDPVNVFMGEVRRGEGRSQIVKVIGREPGFDVTDARLTDTSGSFAVKRLDRTEVTDPSGAILSEVRYQIDLSPSLPINTYRTAVAFSTNDGKRPNVTVQAQASVVGDLRITPDRVWVVGNQPDVPWVRELRIDHRRGESFWITGVESVDVPKHLNVVFDIVPTQGSPSANSGYMIKLSGVIPASSGVLTGKFILRTSVEEQATIEIPLQGNVQIVAPQQ